MENIKDHIREILSRISEIDNIIMELRVPIPDKTHKLISKDLDAITKAAMAVLSLYT